MSNAYDYQWRKVRARTLAGAQGCWICGRPLDYDAPPRSRWSPSVDHVFSVHAARGMDPDTRDRLRLDPSNLRPTHYGCNARRQDGRREKPRHVSREWR